MDKGDKEQHWSTMIRNKEIIRELEKEENSYLIMDFWSFAILATLMVVFFPWSLLFCLFAYGLDETKLIVLALFHDFMKTVFAILAVLVPIVLLIVFLVVILI